MQAIFTISIGLKDKDAKKQIISSKAAMDKIFDTIGDCTILEAYGQFTHADKSRVRENSFRVYVYDDESAFAELCSKAKLLCYALNQECIIVQMTRQNGSFETEFIEQ